MRFGILGPLLVLKGDAICVPSAPKLRNVLAMLLAHWGQAVPAASLIRELWGDKPPASSLTTMQTYILNLRKYFAQLTDLPPEEVARNVLATRAGGYQLQADLGVLDVSDYQSLVVTGRKALSLGDDRGGVQHLGNALRQWRGSALMDVPTGPVLESKRRQYEESRLLALEYLIDAEFRLGRYREVLAELAALTAEHPLHEGWHARYMHALCLSGRRAEALAVFRRMRGHLVDELGLEPGPSVQRLHHAILNNEEGLDVQMSNVNDGDDVVRAAEVCGVRLH